MGDLGIIIVSYNVKELLRNCLNAVFANQGLLFSVCVVDNDSSDRSAEMVEAEFPQVQLIRNGNHGFAHGNNLGLRAFGFGDHVDRERMPRYILLLNPDTEVPHDALSRVVAYMDAHPDVGVLGPKLVRKDGTLDLACRRGFPTLAVSFYRFSMLGKLFPHSPRFGRYNMTHLDPDQIAEIDAVSGAFMLVRREAIEQAGLLDEIFWMYGEDLDWAYRIKQRGWKVMYYPQVEVLHIKRAASTTSPKAHYEFERAMWLFYRKHYRATTPRALDALVRLGLSLRGGRRLMREMRAADRGT